MASGYPGGGGSGGGLPGLYGEIGRSIGGGGGGAQIGNNTNTLIGNPTGNHHNNNMAATMYRFQQQQGAGGGGIMADQTQIGGRRPDTTMIGKRSLAQFQSSYQNNNNNTSSSSSHSNFLLQQQRQQQQQLAFLHGHQQQQQQQHQQSSSSAAVSLLRQNQNQQHQQQGFGMGMGMGMMSGGGVGGGSFLRSVKQRTTTTPTTAATTATTNSYHHNHHNNTLSPISPLSPSIDLCSPNQTHHHNHNLNYNNINNNNSSSGGSTNLSQSHHHQDAAAASCLSSLSSSSSSSAARLGVPLYHHHHHTQNQQQLRLNPANNNNNTSSVSAINNTVVNYGVNQGPPPTIGYSNLCPNRPVSNTNTPDLDNNNNNTGNKAGAIMSLEDLEKELLGDDDFDGLLLGSGDDVVGGGGDAVSVITNSDWSDTFHLLSPTTPQNNNNNTTATTTSSTTNTTPVTPPPPPPPPPPTQPPSQPVVTTPAATQISPSPTSSTSSSCSSSATPPQPPPPSVSAKQLISEAAVAISDGKSSDECGEILSRLSQASNQNGTPEQKLAYYMCHALRCRVSPTENRPPVNQLFTAEHAAAFRGLCDLSPCFKLPLLAANLAILDTIAHSFQENLHRRDPGSGGGGNGVGVGGVTTSKATTTTVHIVDFDIGGGDQYAHLLRAVPSSQVHALEIRITAVDIDATSNSNSNSSSSKSLEGVKDMLTKVAERTGLPFRFDSVSCNIPELSRDVLGCVDGETLVVNFAYRLFRVPDESVSMENLRDDLLRRVKGMCPCLVTLVEQEMNVNTAPFATRVAECGVYYGEVIDSLVAAGSSGSSNSSRGDLVGVVEEGLGRKAANVVACEGRERVERCEVFGKWRARMGMAGFQGRMLTTSGGGSGQSVAESMRAKLCDPGRGGNPKFVVKEDGFGVCFGWNGRTLTVASAWR